MNDCGHVVCSHLGGPCRHKPASPVKRGRDGQRERQLSELGFDAEVESGSDGMSTITLPTRQVDALAHIEDGLVDRLRAAIRSARAELDDVA